jgi:hypothetical protein
MGAGPLSSDSTSDRRSQDNTGPVTASQGTAQSTQQGGKSKSISQGGINLEKGANIAGLTLGNIGKGATVTLSAPAAAPFDTHALDRAADALDSVVRFQSDHTAAALQATGNIGQPASSAPPPDTGGIGSKVFLFLGGLGVAAVLLVALAIVKKKGG